MEYIINKIVNDISGLSEVISNKFNIDFNIPGNYIILVGDKLLLITDKQIPQAELDNIVNNFVDKDNAG